jgi:hypothetical protein
MFLERDCPNCGAVSAWPTPTTTKQRRCAFLGRAAEARQELDQARGVAEEIGARLILWQILAAQAEMESEAGNEDRAAERRREARQIVGYIADHAGSAGSDPFGRPAGCTMISAICLPIITVPQVGTALVAAKGRHKTCPYRRRRFFC